MRARLALAEGDPEAAERWARSAVEIASQTDAPIGKADAHVDLARVLIALGQPREAASEARAAVELYEAKGDQHSGAAAEALLDEAQGQSGSQSC